MDGDEERLGRPVDFGGARDLQSEPLDGRYARLEPLDPVRHGDDLWAGASAPGGDATWDYLPNGPFATRDAFDAWLGEHSLQDDPRPFALIDRADGRAKGTACFMRMVPAMGVIEIGHIWMTPTLQRTRTSTDAIAIMMRHAFDGLGNRRLEWKCNALNAASRRAERTVSTSCASISGAVTRSTGSSGKNGVPSGIASTSPVKRRAASRSAATSVFARPTSRAP